METLDVNGLREAFNGSRESVRLVTILSPS